MRLKTLSTSWQRSLGAMFHRRLGDTILLFSYSKPAQRLFHTFFCPPLRIITLNDDGETLFDRVVPPSHFVRLPASRLIVEADPEQELTTSFLRELARDASKVR